MARQVFTTITRGLDRESPIMHLYEKAKQLGVWNPSDIDLAQDILDWQWLKDSEKDVVLRLTALFQAGEEAVTLDLLPLISVIAQEGRLEEELFLTAFLWEEGKHTDFFNRFLRDVARAPKDLSRYHTPNYRKIFCQALPRTLHRLQTDASPTAQAEASVTYSIIIEGVLAETGYHAYATALERNGLMPGTRKAVTLLKQDESRHIAYGIFLLSRLVAAHPRLWQVIEDKMNDLLPVAIGVIGDAFACYDQVPFGLVADDFVNYATAQFQKRIERIEKARGQSLEQVFTTTQQVIEQEDA